MAKKKPEQIDKQTIPEEPEESDAKKMEDMRLALELEYAKKYLADAAVKEVEGRIQQRIEQSTAKPIEALAGPDQAGAGPQAEEAEPKSR
jgi:hypothetical protein